MKLVDLFSGIGGFSLAAHWMGWETVCFVEKDEFCQRVLAKNFPGVPIYGDIHEFSGRELTADIICGGFPCQDVSTAGKGQGITGERSWLWKEMFRIVSEVRPRFVVVENVATLLGRGMDVVLADLSEIGYDAEWRVFSACELGFPHTRERVFVVAYPNGQLGQRFVVDRYCGTIARRDYDAKKRLPNWYEPEMVPSADSVLRAWQLKFSASPLVRVADGIPNLLDRIRCAGNSIVPQIAYEIFRAIEQAEQ